MLIGVISDTHGLLRPQAVDALGDAELIIHAGDIGPRRIVEELAHIAPVHVVRGNCDHGEWAALPETEVVDAGGTALYVIHDIGGLDLDPSAAGFAAIIYGHSHRPEIGQRGGVLYLNPGSAGPRRFSLPVSVARLHVAEGELRAELVELDS